MNLLFTLSMPGCPSWNGKWSGENEFYGIIKSFSTKKSKEFAAKILEKGYFTYRWQDGWRAGIEVKEISGAEKRKISKKLKGFCGYDWMVSSICETGELKDEFSV